MMPMIPVPGEGGDAIRPKAARLSLTYDEMTWLVLRLADLAQIEADEPVAPVLHRKVDEARRRAAAAAYVAAVEKAPPDA